MVFLSRDNVLFQMLSLCPLHMSTHIRNSLSIWEICHKEKIYTESFNISVSIYYHKHTQNIRKVDLHSLFLVPFKPSFTKCFLLLLTLTQAVQSRATSFPETASACFLPKPGLVMSDPSATVERTHCWSTPVSNELHSAAVSDFSI